MRTIDFPEVNKTFYIPSSLAECNEKEYKVMSELLYQYYNEMIDYNDLKNQATASFLGYKKSAKSCVRSLSTISLISDCIDTFFSNKEGKKSVDLDFIDSKIPCVKVGFRKYYSTGDAFEKMTYGQYADASRFFMMFNENPDSEFLYIIASILYLRKKGVYKSKDVDRRKELFKKHLSPGIVFGIYLQFASFQKYLSEAEIQWGDHTLDFSIMFSGETTESNIPGIGADSLVFTIAETGMLGKADEVRNSRFWEVMILMYDLRKRDLDRNDKVKKDAVN